MPAKMKVLVAMPAYGAGGGALLGFASMAFGTEPRAIAIGASLGLYAGILFAGYIILSYQYRQSVPNVSEGSPYGVDDPGYGDTYEEGAGAAGPEESFYYADPATVRGDQFAPPNANQLRLKMNLLQIRF